MIWQILFCVLCGFLLAQVATLATTMYLHRSSTHKSVEYHSSVQFFFQFVLWLTTGINRREWVAVHLCHHAHTDEAGDPHSPILLGESVVQVLNPKLYRNATKKPEVMSYGKNIQLSWAERNLFCSKQSGLLFGIATAILIFGLWQGLLFSASHAVFYLQLNALVNAYCHVRGYKNFSNAHAFNSRWVAWFTGGEGYHNNHHHMPGNPKLSEKSREFDIGWGLIRILTWLRLARVTRANR